MVVEIETCHQPCANCNKQCNQHSHIHDITIIGAGAIGTSIGRELSRYKLSVTVLEKSNDVSQGASKSNSGIIHGGYDDKHGTLKSKLSHKGNQLFSILDKELQFGFKRIGSLVLAFNQLELEMLNQIKQNGELNGVQDLELLTKEQVVKKEPFVNKEVMGALFCPHTGITSPYEYVIALAENAVTNGCQILLNHEVTDIIIVSNDTSNIKQINSTLNSHFLVRCANGKVFRSKIVVNAAGLMADRVAAMVGANNFSITPRKGEYIILNKSQGHFANHVLFPVPTSAGKGILVSRTLHGNLLLGPTSRGAGEASLNQRQILQLILGSAKHTIPEFDPTQAITSYTGLRSKSNNHDFIIEESGIVPGFINVAGIDSPGLTSSPAVAILVIEIIRKSLSKWYKHTMELNPTFNPNRKPIIIKKNDFHGKIDHQEAHLNIICRCEKTTESEIVDAIHRPLGATDVDSVKRRTRAGMGQCQGNKMIIR
jgi:glycerol-3-phosphate dehydrogenase